MPRLPARPSVSVPGLTRQLRAALRAVAPVRRAPPPAAGPGLVVRRLWTLRGRTALATPAARARACARWARDLGRVGAALGSRTMPAAVRLGALRVDPLALLVPGRAGWLVAATVVVRH